MAETSKSTTEELVTHFAFQGQQLGNQKAVRGLGGFFHCAIRQNMAKNVKLARNEKQPKQAFQGGYFVEVFIFFFKYIIIIKVSQKHSPLVTQTENPAFSVTTVTGVEG